MARVTVIDDSTEFLDLMRDLIEEIGHEMVGFEAVTASFEQIVESEPDLLILDLRLQDTPQMISGWELLVLARSHKELVSTPVILCTADVMELKKRADDLEQIAGVHVRTKPFAIDEMSDLITELIERDRPRPISAAR